MILGLKRTLRDLPFLILLLAIIAVPLLGYETGKNIKTAPFGYVSEGNSSDEKRLCKELEAAGFIECDSERKLKEEITSAHLDCGIVISDDLDDALRTGRTDEIIKLITSPETAMSELCRIETVSALSIVYSPYVTKDALGDAFDTEAVKEAYYGMVDSGKLFDFDFRLSSGISYNDDSRSMNLFIGCLSILIFITAFINISRPVKKHYDEIKGRLGRTSAWLRVLLPELIIRVFFEIIAALLTCFILGKPELFETVVFYSLIVNTIGLIAVMICSESVIIILTVFVSILSLGICPVFTDLTLAIPGADIIRYCLLPYYLWIL